jgi:DNA-binding transcriptional ArsR family regulator
MVNHNQRHLDLAFGALAHPIRRGILARLSAGEASVAELAKPYNVSAPAISKHMRILEDAGLLSRKKQGRVLEAHHDRCWAPLDATTTEIEAFRGGLPGMIEGWSGTFERLDAFLERSRAC